MSDKFLIGNQEWVSLPKLGLPAIKAKVDTGARTSAIHAFNIQLLTKKKIQFDIHPISGNNEISVQCTAKVVDQRTVMSSNGMKEERYVIQTPMRLGEQTWIVELTLSNREPLRYRMLLGRQALAGHVIIDPMLNCKLGKKTKVEVLNSYPSTTKK